MQKHCKVVLTVFEATVLVAYVECQKRLKIVCSVFLMCVHA